MQQEIDFYKILRSCEHYIIYRCPKCGILTDHDFCPNCVIYPLKKESLWVGRSSNLEDNKIGYNEEFMAD